MCTIGQNAKFAKRVKMANFTCNGRGNRSVKYAQLDVLRCLRSFDQRVTYTFTSQRFQDSVAEIYEN